MLEWLAPTVRVRPCGVRRILANLDDADRLVLESAMDNGSGWFRTKSGEDSIPGLATLILEQDVDYTGTVFKL